MMLKYVDSLCFLLIVLQGDYYETGTWLSQEEKDQIAEKEKKRLEKYQARGRQAIKVSFDLAGRYSLSPSCAAPPHLAPFLSCCCLVPPEGELISCSC
jgi:hypothetical protein